MIFVVLMDVRCVVEIVVQIRKRFGGVKLGA
jgi:hypothetical protein